MSKLTVIFLALLIFAHPVLSQSAREYYNELYKAGGLDVVADENVCFDDDPANQNFFIFAPSAHVREVLTVMGTFAKLPKKDQEMLKGDFLIARGYTKGVPFSDEDFYDKDNDSWVINDLKLGKTTPVRIRISISWATLRYKRSVEILNADSTYKSEVARFGKCEPIAGDARQKDQ